MPPLKRGLFLGGPLGHPSTYKQLITMGLFNFSAPDASAGQDIQLLINDETVTIPAVEAQGMSVREVFAKFASSLCDTTRINRYVSQGRIVAGDSKAAPGTIYSGAIASESKG